MATASRVSDDAIEPGSDDVTIPKEVTPADDEREGSAYDDDVSTPEDALTEHTCTVLGKNVKGQ